MNMDENFNLGYEYIPRWNTFIRTLEKIIDKWINMFLESFSVETTF